MHPLEHKWKIWYDVPPQRSHAPANWEDLLKPGPVIETVEHFWQVFDKLKPATEVVGNFHLFRDGIKPMWEDAQNKNGGKWVFQKSIPIGIPSQRYQMFNVVWLKTMLSCIGEQFGDYNDDICGCVFNTKCTKSYRIFRIAIWIKAKNDKSATKEIGRKFKEILELNESTKISFSWHDDSVKNGIGYSSKSHMEI